MDMKNKLIVAVTVLGVAGLSSTIAEATTFTVDAITPLGSWLDTGMNFNPGTAYDFTVINPSTLWSAGNDVPYPRTSTATGIDPIASGYGQYTQGGYTFNFGALVGEVGSTFFLIGTGPTILSSLSGELYVGYWDPYYQDNSGSQQLSIAATPLPSTWTMMLIGLAGIGFVGYRQSKKATLPVAV